MYHHLALAHQGEVTIHRKDDMARKKVTYRVEGQHRRRVDTAAAKIRAGNRDELIPCACTRLADGWESAGCRRHRPIRSYVGYEIWGRDAEA
jgi:hypothetical protein